MADQERQLTTTGLDVQTLHALVVGQDMAKLTPAQQVQYYLSLCDAAGLDPRTKPFALLSLNGKLVPYALKTATDQLRAKKNLSITITRRETVDELAVVEVLITDGERQDTELGIVSIGGLKGDALANAHMKALTKAKRRATLSFCGLGMLDEGEIETIPNARPVRTTTDREHWDYVASDAEATAEPTEAGPGPAQEADPQQQAIVAEQLAKMRTKWARCTDKAKVGTFWTQVENAVDSGTLLAETVEAFRKETAPI